MGGTKDTQEPVGGCEDPERSRASCRPQESYLATSCTPACSSRAGRGSLAASGASSQQPSHTQTPFFEPSQCLLSHPSPMNGCADEWQGATPGTGSLQCSSAMPPPAGSAPLGRGAQVTEALLSGGLGWSLAHEYSVLPAAPSVQPTGSGPFPGIDPPSPSPAALGRVRPSLSPSTPSSPAEAVVPGSSWGVRLGSPSQLPWHCGSMEGDRVALDTDLQG